MRMTWTKAASALQVLALAAPPGPWKPGRRKLPAPYDRTISWVDVNHAKGYRAIQVEQFPGAARYIATMDPHVALAVAGLLRKLPEAGEPMPMGAVEAANELATGLLERIND